MTSSHLICRKAELLSAGRGTVWHDSRGNQTHSLGVVKLLGWNENLSSFFHTWTDIDTYNRSAFSSHLFKTVQIFFFCLFVCFQKSSIVTLRIVSEEVVLFSDQSWKAVLSILFTSGKFFVVNIRRETTLSRLFAYFFLTNRKLTFFKQLLVGVCVCVGVTREMMGSTYLHVFQVLLGFQGLQKVD